MHRPLPSLFAPAHHLTCAHPFARACILVGPPALSRILVAPAALPRIKVYTPASLRIFVDGATNTRETVGNMHERAVCALTSVWQGGWVQ